MKSLFSLLAAIAALLGAPAVSAQIASAPVVSEQSAVRLAPVENAVVPGETFHLALEIKHAHHWHTYWTNPGDSGAPTQIRWTLPEGYEAGEAEFPTPRRIPTGPLVNFGYEDDLVLLTPITAPADAAPGTTVRIVADAYWLICDDICIPEQGSFAIDMPVATSAAPNGDWSEKALKAREAAPRDLGWIGRFAVDGDVLQLSVDAPAITIDAAPELFPYEDGLIENAADQNPRVKNGVLSFAIPAGFTVQDGETPESFDAVIAVDDDSGAGAMRRGFKVNFTQDASFAAGGPAAGVGGLDISSMGIAQALVFAFFGGLILNLMPCVFPVLSLKAMSLLHAQDDAKAEARKHGLFYTVGVVATFALLGGGLLALRAGGEQIGWGFQLQSPVIVAALGYLMLLVGLNLSGVFEIGTSLQGAGSGLAAKGGSTGAFFTGVLAVAVAAPCTAPIMCSAHGAALAAPPAGAMAVFMALGLGLAAPFLLISIAPQLASFLPRPGAWMKTFKEVLAFPMYGAVVWLLWTLSFQTGPLEFAWALAGGVILALAAYLFGLGQKARGKGRTVGYGLAGAAAAAALALSFLNVDGGSGARAATTVQAGESGFERTAAFSMAALDDLRAGGEPVFVDFTAKWCITCQVNKGVAINKAKTYDAFNAAGITFMTADWTNNDPEITAALQSFGRAGVPLYVYYPSNGGDGVILPQVLTVDVILNAIDKAEAAAGAVSAAR